MAISDNDSKTLWGRAGGICSNPACRVDLTVILGEVGYNVGEMAHIIARSPDGPRGIVGGGVDNYANLILLCPTCHRKIDKAPVGEYPVGMLNGWKEQHEKSISSAGRERVFDSLRELKDFIRPLLVENRSLWSSLGPQSEIALTDLGSNLHIVWTMRKLDRVIPNNIRLVNVIESNMHLLNDEQLEAFMDFKVHAGAFEANQYGRIDSYPTFPKRFADLFAS